MAGCRSLAVALGDFAHPLHKGQLQTTHSPIQCVPGESFVDVFLTIHVHLVNESESAGIYTVTPIKIQLRTVLFSQ